MLKITNIFLLRLGFANPPSGVIGGGGACAHAGNTESSEQRTKVIQIKKKNSALNES
jgi:hypothetical protein